MQEVVVENDEEPEANNDQEDEPIEVGGFLQLKILRLSYKKLWNEPENRVRLKIKIPPK